MRSVSVRWRSAASVRSIAGASVRTLIASTARAGERPTTITVSIAVTQARARTATDVLPASPLSTSRFAGLTQFRERPRRVTFTPIYVDFAARACRDGLERRLRRSGRAGEKEQEFHGVAMVSTILPICALVSMRAWAAAASRQREGAVDHRPDPARRDQRQHLLLDGARDRGLVGDRARAQRRAGVGEALEHDAAEIDGGLRAAPGRRSARSRPSTAAAS